MSAPKFLYFLPLHNEAAIVRRSVDKLLHALAPYPGSQVFLLENASTDDTGAIAKSLEQTRDGITVRAFSTPKAGMGAAYRMGLENLSSDAGSYRVVFTAADLPFGFSDLRNFLPLSPNVELAIGSKGHPLSQASRGPAREAMTLTFRLLRRVIIGMRTKDCQGTLFLRGDLACQMQSIPSDGFFFTTEMVYRAEKNGWNVVEMPIEYLPEERPSTVRPWKHGTAMLRQLWQLRLASGRV